MFANVDTFAEFVGVIVGAVNSIVWLLTGIALLAFMVAGVRFMFDVSGGPPKAERKKTLVWSLVALFVLVSIGGITQLLIYTFLPDTVPYQEDWTNSSYDYPEEI